MSDLQELNKDTLTSYVKKAEKSVDANLAKPVVGGKKDHVRNRVTGIERAEKKLAKEEVEQVDELSVGTLNSYADRATAKRKKLTFVAQIAEPKVGHKADKMRGDIAKARAKSAIKTISRGPAPSKAKVHEEVEQIDELSNDKLTAYKKAAADKPLAKDGDKTAGGILRAAQKRINGVKMANKKLGEATGEEINEKALSLLKAVIGKSDNQKAAKASAEFAARRKERLEREAAAAKAPKSPKDSTWGHVEYKKGTNVREEAALDEAAVKIPAHDEIAGNLPHAPAAAETIKLATKGQLKMLAQAARTKYVSHTNVEVPGTQVKEEVEQVDEISKATLKDYVPKAAARVATIGYRHGRDKESRTADRSSAEQDNDTRKSLNHMAGIRKAVSKLAKEEVEQVDELSNDTLRSYVTKAASTAVSAGRNSGFHLARGEYSKEHEADRKTSKRLKGVVKAVHKIKENTMISFKDYLKIMTEEFIVESEELNEEFISHSDFESKVQNHKSHGMVVHHDYDHKAKKAIIRHVDHDGEVREFHYHEKGTTVQRLAPKRGMGKPAAATTEKRGRGRPAGSKNK